MDAGVHPCLGFCLFCFCGSRPLLKDALLPTPPLGCCAQGGVSQCAEELCSSCLGPKQLKTSCRRAEALPLVHPPPPLLVPANCQHYLPSTVFLKWVLQWWRFWHVNQKEWAFEPNPINKWLNISCEFKLWFFFKSLECLSNLENVMTIWELELRKNHHWTTWNLIY